MLNNWFYIANKLPIVPFTIILAAKNINKDSKINNGINVIPSFSLPFFINPIMKEPNIDVVIMLITE